ncbi:MAG: glycosyltransferase family 4 protein [Candidatus Sungbacteria bacterium]|nr:glycosyltransferase family 4 protein [Candidatus Sungbacteria bacterium]
MGRKKILFVITKSVWGGAGKYVYDIATHLPTDRFDSAVAAGGNGLLFQKLESAGVRTIRIPELDRDIHIGKELRSFRALLDLFRHEQPDIIHLNSSKIGGLGAIAAFLSNFKIQNSKFKIVYTVHGWGFLEDRPLLWRAAAFLASWASALFQDRLILINHHDYEIARKFIPRRKLRLIFNATTETDFLPHNEARTFFSKKIKREIIPGTLLIGTIAELTKNKGLNYLIEAAKHVHCHSRESGNPEPTTTGFPIHKDLAQRDKSGMTNIKVLIIGDGEERKNLEQQICDLHLEDTVFLLGFIPDAATYLSGMDIFVLPSVKEGLPYVVMEAMAAGLPVIASNVGGIPDLISHNETGMLAPSKDPKALAEAIESLSKDPQLRATLGTRARETVRTKFSLRAMLEKTQELYEAAD